MSSKIKTCFISAPAGANLKVLRKVLHKKNIRVVVPEELPLGSNWSSEISSILAEVDLVIGILTRSRSSDSVLFELGQAWALGRHILLFAPPKFKAIQFDLQRFLVIRVSLTNQSAISFALDQLLASPTSERKGTTSRRSTVQGLGDRANQFLREFQDAMVEGQGRKFEELVARVIRESGVDIIQESPTPEKRADLAIWSDALQPLVGNPLVIEVKQTLRSSQSVQRAAQQLSAVISASGASWGVLLYGEGPEETIAWRSLPSNVLALSVPDLIRQMEDRAFVDVIKEHRNQRVHGARP